MVEVEPAFSDPELLRFILINVGIILVRGATYLMLLIGAVLIWQRASRWIGGCLLGSSTALLLSELWALWKHLVMMRIMMLSFEQTGWSAIDWPTYFSMSNFLPQLVMLIFSVGFLGLSIQLSRRPSKM